MRAVLDLEGAIGRADLSFIQLLHTVRTGEPAFPVQFGWSFWDDLAADPTRSASFDAQMAADVTAWAPDIVAAYDWGSLGHLVDVGGGNGALLATLLREYPGLRGTVLDLPGAAEAARKALTAAGLAHRSDATPGSFFDPLPPSAGGYLLCAVLHDWDDGSARTILRRCAEAAGTHGRVFVVEKFVTDSDHRTEMDLRVLVYFGGRERDLAELTARRSCGAQGRRGASRGGHTGRRTDCSVTAPGAPTAVVAAPGSSGRDPLRVHASRRRRQHHRTRPAVISDNSAQDHECHDPRLEHRTRLD